MNILNAHEQTNTFFQKLSTLAPKSFDTEMENIKMCVKGKISNTLEHQWKQPLNYISTNLLNLEIQAEMSQLNLENINDFNNNVEKAIQQISNDISSFNQLFKNSTSKNQFILSDIATKYFHIIEHKLRKSDIQFDYQSLQTSKDSFFNYECEYGLIIVLFLYLLSDDLINETQKEILLQLEVQNKILYIYLNNSINQNRLFKHYHLELYLIKLLLQKTQLQLDCSCEENRISYRLYLQDRR